MHGAYNLDLITCFLDWKYRSIERERLLDLREHIPVELSLIERIVPMYLQLLNE